MLSHSSPSNLSEALLNAKKLENSVLKREFTIIDRERNKIRASVDRHMETFLKTTRKRHETWYRHDNHFREAMRKEKEQFEKRKELTRQKILFNNNPNYVPQTNSPFQPIADESLVLPPVTTTITETEMGAVHATPPPRSPSPRVGKEILLPITTKYNTPTKTTPRAEPMTKVERRTHQVLRAARKLLDESAARSKIRSKPERPPSVSFNHKRASPAVLSSSCSFNSGTLIVPMTTLHDCEEYDRLMEESLQHETFSEFVDHFVKFRPEFREQFGLINEAAKRQRAMEKLREFNQIHAKVKDERYHRLISSLTDLRPEENDKLL